MNHNHVGTWLGRMVRRLRGLCCTYRKGVGWCIVRMPLGHHALGRTIVVVLSWFPLRTSWFPKHPMNIGASHRVDAYAWPIVVGSRHRIGRRFGSRMLVSFVTLTP